LFTTEFYARVRDYLAPGGLFGQWLHTYELTDGLVLSVLAALHQNFADYRIFLINGGDLLVVANPGGPLPRPDWGVTRLPEVARDLCRFLPLSDAALERTLVLDRAGLLPLLARGVAPNSDFYPVLDLGAEPARFLQRSAAGVAGLGSGPVGFVADSALWPASFDGGTASALLPAPGVRALVLAGELRRPAIDTGWSDALGASERWLRRVWTRQSIGDGAGINWRGWTNDFWTLRRALHGGGAPPDTAFLGLAQSFVRLAGGPAGAAAAVELGAVLAHRRFPDGVAAVERLLAEVRGGRQWVPPDDLLDGSVRVLLAAGRPDAAREAYDLLRPYSTRTPGDLRLALLDATIDAARGGGQ
jgi:hypothetical protein